MCSKFFIGPDTSEKRVRDTSLFKKDKIVWTGVVPSHTVIFGFNVSRGLGPKCSRMVLTCSVRVLFKKWLAI